MLPVANHSCWISKEQKMALHVSLKVIETNFFPLLSRWATKNMKIKNRQYEAMIMKSRDQFDQS